MELTTVSSLNRRKNADLIVLPFWQEDKKAKPACAIKEFSSILAPAISAGDFLGKEGEVLLLYRGKAKEQRVMLIGIGSKKAISQEVLRKSYSAVVKTCRQKKLTKINVVLPNAESLTDKDVCHAITEGLLLTNYAFDQLRGEKEDLKPLIEKACLIGADKQGEEACKKAIKLITSVNMTRDLVNGNADEITPQFLSKLAEDLAKQFSAVKTTVLDKKGIEKEKMGLLLAVNRGSALEPAFIVMEYLGNPKSSDRTAIVGKGITYDTGGLNIKPQSGMLTMKCDMSGAAAVLGVIRAAASLGLKQNIIGVIASTENAIGSKSYKTGDVYRSRSGKTVEIIDTDAEGRLVLADALSYTQDKLKPSRIIDLATLTGSIGIALGDEATGLFTNDDELSDALIKAGEKTHERLWRLPIFPEYKESLKSSIADLKNVGAARKAGASVAAVFLQQFIKKGTPWAHLDIASTAYMDPKGYHPTCATGMGVRLLLEFLEHCK